MKNIILIMDGASGYPHAEGNNKTSLEFAQTPHLDRLASEGQVGLAKNVPEGMEPSSAIACMSLIGYDPKQYYAGRGPIEAFAMGLDLAPGEVAFRCNLVTLEQGSMKSYCAGQISDAEAHALIEALSAANTDERIRFYPGVSYRHIAIVKDGMELLSAVCTPPHDISDKPIAAFRPHGKNSDYLNQVMHWSEGVLANHPVNLARKASGKAVASSAWLFWGGGHSTKMPTYTERYRVSAALTSGVDLLRGLARLTGMEVLSIPGVSGGLDTNYVAQIEGALAALQTHDLVVIHVESPDESGHLGSFKEKVKAIESIDSLMVRRILQYAETTPLRLLVLPDHPTPVALKTHTAEPVPFLLWGSGIEANGAQAYSENEAQSTGLMIEEGHSLVSRLF